MTFIRKICYVYHYEGTRKSENVGFVRIQAQNGAAKLFMNVKLPAHIQAKRVTLYLAGEGTPEFRTAIGNLNLMGREWSFKTVISVENAAGSGRPLSDYDGILAYDENGYSPLFGASFTENELSESFFAQDAFPVSVQSDNLIEDKKNNDAITEMENDEVTAQKDSGAEKSGMPDAAAEETAGQTEQESEASDADITEMSAEHMVPKKTVPSAMWMNMTRNIGKLCILEQGECVAIRPFQMSRLPQKYWQLTGNRYVRHGYYIYGHLILARTVDQEGNEQIWLGVPGGSGENEEKEARMFGFRHYIKRTAGRQDGMPEGYWCMLLK